MLGFPLRVGTTRKFQLGMINGDQTVDEPWSQTAITASGADGGPVACPFHGTWQRTGAFHRNVAQRRLRCDGDRQARRRVGTSWSHQGLSLEGASEWPNWIRTYAA